MQKWEYKKTRLDLAQSVINQLGSAGWELVGMIEPRVGSGFMIFKRPKAK